MTIHMYLSESQAQADSIGQICQEQLKGYECLETKVRDFIGSVQLKGLAYDATRDYFNEVYKPLLKASILLTEKVNTAVRKLPEQYLIDVDSCDLNSDLLEEKIWELEQRINELKDQQRQINLSSLSSEFQSYHQTKLIILINICSSAKRELEKQLQQLIRYSSYSVSFFSEIKQLESAIKMGLNCCQSGWDSEKKQFSLKNIDTSWTKPINEQWIARDKLRKGIDDRTIERLKAYQIYAVPSKENEQLFYWHLFKDNIPVKNSELTNYLRKSGKYLDAKMFTKTNQETVDQLIQSNI